ncbi:MAG: hypothetical protein QOI10_3145 [Solirubrobacterales bacterium]|jgi:hypothetical protein|nr:hypothetical protein [Solirubrobacterales bacterium]
MDLRSRLTYANVVATLALVLAVGGGTVYAALHLGKNSVKSKNIAKGAVQNSDLGPDAVTGPKVKDGAIAAEDIQDGTITAQDIAAGVIPQLEADVTGSATAGPQGSVNTATTSPLPLSGTTSFTPNEGEVSAVAAEAQFTIATTNAANQCSPAVIVLVNGQPTRVFVNPESGQNSTTLVQASGHDADGPFGLLNPGTPLTVTAQLRGDADCTAASQLNKVEVRILQIR